MVAHFSWTSGSFYTRILRRLNIRDFEIEDLETFKNSFNNTNSRYKIDEYVYLCEGDNRLLLDLKRDEALKLIYLSLKKNRELILCEAEIYCDTIVKDSCRNPYIAEFVFSFIQHETNKNIEQLNEEDNFMQDNRIFQGENNEFSLGADGWIYIKLYGVGDRENELLTKELTWLLDRLDVQKFFFIRYSDGEKHLRIRFKFENESIAIDKLHIINSWNSDLKKNCLISRPVFDVYQRESNRYGGIRLIEYAEQFFYIDSLFVIKMLSLFDLDNENDRKLVYMVGMISALKELTYDENELFNILDEDNLRKQYRDEFRKERLNYIRITEYVLNGELEKVDDRLSQVMNIHKRRQESLSDFRIHLEDQIKNGDITNRKDEIIFSLTHMYCNRMTGIIGYESKFLSMIRHSLYDLIRKWKYAKKKMAI